MTDFYDASAKAFISNTRDVDMSDMHRRFLSALPIFEGKTARILDAGSGAGRDALAFRLLGHKVEAAVLLRHDRSITLQYILQTAPEALTAVLMT